MPHEQRLQRLRAVLLSDEDAALLDAQSNQIPLITRVETMAYRSDLVDASAIRHKDGYADNLYGVANYKSK